MSTLLNITYPTPDKAKLLRRYRFRLPLGWASIPAGYTWDGATIPRIAWSIVGLTPFGAHNEATLKHDWLYGYEGNIPGYPEKLSRKFVDNLFFADLEAIGFSGIRLFIIKRFVRAGGYWFWREL